MTANNLCDDQYIVGQADLILHVGLNARLEATMLNVRIRQRWLRGGLTVGTIGAPVRLTYDHQNLGLTPAALVELANGNHPFCEALAAAEKPLILYGSAVLERDDAASIVSLLKSLNAQTKVGGRAPRSPHAPRRAVCVVRLSQPLCHGKVKAPFLVVIGYRVRSTGRFICFLPCSGLVTDYGGFSCF